MDMLDDLVGLSHGFGTAEYVRGGGGNTSCKDAETLWIKPSGTTLGEMARELFVALDRAKVAEVFSARMAPDAVMREAEVKAMMTAAVRAGSSGRPSVEAPLHESFDAAFVVHVHPALVNGMTCAQDGAAACASMFPGALWVPYTDPGYTLSMACRKAMAAYAANHGAQPGMMFLQNHGVFVAGNSAVDIQSQYHLIMSTLRAAYERAGVSVELAVGPQPSAGAVARVTAQLRAAMGDAAAGVSASGLCAVSDGPISPDHILFAGSYPLIGEPTPEAVAAYREQWGCLLRVVTCGAGVFGVGPAEKDAAMALEFAQDGAQVKQLAEAFGGINYVDDAARKFIENWEVEAYRRKVAMERETGENR